MCVWDGLLGGTVPRVSGKPLRWGERWPPVGVGSGRRVRYPGTSVLIFVSPIPSQGPCWGECRLCRAWRLLHLGKQDRATRWQSTPNPAVVNEYLAKEMGHGRVVQVDPAAMEIHINRFGVIPKGHRTGKWRHIVDLSHPAGHSVSDGVDPVSCSLSYATVEMAAQQVIAIGRGTLLAKLDLESAYRMVPVHPDDRRFLGMQWQGKVLVDMALPFGLRSAPKVFNLLADCLQWIFQHHGIEFVIHYLDDFLYAGQPGAEECREYLQQALAPCEELGVQVSLEKLVGPAMLIEFLGILLDTHRLPTDKLLRLRRFIQEWRGKLSCTKRELLSLIGQLQHACKVVRPGRTFLRRMIELSMVAKQLHHHICLNKGFQSDLEWWALFLPTWNGIAMMSSVALNQQPQLLQMPLVGGAVERSHLTASGFSTGGQRHGSPCISQ